MRTFSTQWEGGTTSGQPLATTVKPWNHLVVNALEHYLECVTAYRNCRWERAHLVLLRVLFLFDTFGLITFLTQPLSDPPWQVSHKEKHEVGPVVSKALVKLYAQKCPKNLQMIKNMLEDHGLLEWWECIIVAVTRLVVWIVKDL